MNEPARVLIPISTGMSWRNIHCTELHREMLAAGLRPVYLVPEALCPVCRSEVPPGEADVDVLPDVRLPVHDAILRDLAFATVQRRHRVATMDIRRRLARRAQPGIPLKQRIEPLLGRSRAVHDLLNAVRSKLSRAPEMQAPFDRWPVDLVFSNNVFSLSEAAVLRRARDLKVPTVGMVHSWDNPTNKGMLPSPVDRLLVWSEVTRDEMTSLYYVSEDRIRIVGSPQFDIYHQPIPIPRDALLAHYGFAPDTKLILYGTGSPVHGPGEPDYCRTLADLASSPVGLLVRLHPRDQIGRYAGIADRAGVVVAEPGRRDDGVPDGWAPSREDHEHFAALMRYADVVVNLASTMALDAAANDRPTVHVRYDPEPGLPYLDSVERLFDYTHTARLLGWDASAVVRSPEELRAAVQAALDQPAERREQRRALAESEGVLGEGDSAARIAAEIRTSVASGS